MNWISQNWFFLLFGLLFLGMHLGHGGHGGHGRRDASPAPGGSRPEANVTDDVTREPARPVRPSGHHH